QVDAQPREMSFARHDPSPLLPTLLRDAGFATAGVSAHTWVSPESELGRDFEHFELLPFTAEDAHGDAAPLVDRALALPRARSSCTSTSWTHPFRVGSPKARRFIPYPTTTGDRVSGRTASPRSTVRAAAGTATTHRTSPRPTAPTMPRSTTRACTTRT